MPEHLPEASAARSCRTEQTRTRTDVEPSHLPETSCTSVTHTRAYADSEIAEIRAERDHWRAMYDAMTAAARAGIKSRSEAITHPEGA